ncbi:MAG: thiolase family protein [Archangium sp.]|nr:thiolase family protein [Archangium sp.]MDP3569031.1 thiolase family protein [Archangium sp.]
MNVCYVADAVRTPIGKLRSALKDCRPDDLLSLVIAEIVRRTGIDGAQVDELYAGCANQAGEDNRNVARMAGLLAGLPDTVPAATVNRLCGSGLEAIIQGARQIRLGEADLVIAGGVESMTRAPWSTPKPNEAFPGGKLESWDTSLGWRYPNPKLAARFPLEGMGETAENVAERLQISREDQDRFALASHQKAVRAQQAGAFAAELVSVELPQKKGPAIVVAHDEQPRGDSTLEKLSTLKPAFREGGTVTAGNSSTLNDGASAVVLMSERAVKAWGKTPLARFVSSGTAGLDPRVMGLGPVPATRKALERASWKLGELELIELNEAFAAQSLGCIRELELDESRVNVNGGAIALGHPLGMSGARIVATLTHAMRARGAKKGLVAMCIGVGQGIAATFEAP